MAESAGNWSTIVDLVAIDGSTRPVILEWDGAADEPAAEALYAAWKTDYTAVGEGKVKGHRNLLSYEEGSFTLPTSQDAEPGEHAIIITNISATKKAVVNLPFPKSGDGIVYVDDVGPQRNVVDTTSTALANYLDNFTTGKAYISDGEHSLGNVLSGRRS